MVHIHTCGQNTHAHTSKKEEEKKEPSLLSVPGTPGHVCDGAPGHQPISEGSWGEMEQMFSGLFLNRIASFPCSEAKAEHSRLLGPGGRVGKDRNPCQRENRRSRWVLLQSGPRGSKEAGRGRGEGSTSENLSDSGVVTGALVTVSALLSDIAGLTVCHDRGPLN